MEIDSIITLDDNKEYVILDKVTINNVDYLMVVGVENEELTQDAKYLKVEIEGADTYVVEVEDEELLKNLTTIFASKYFDDSLSVDEEA